MLDPRCENAIVLAKRVLREGERLDIGLLLDALFHATDVKERFPALGVYLHEPRPQRDVPLAKVPVAEPLQPLLRKALDRKPSPGPEEFFLMLARSDAGRRFLQDRGLPATEFENALAATGAGAPPGDGGDDSGSGWRGSAEREDAVRALDSYGRMLTGIELPSPGIVEFEKPLKSLVRTLSRMRRRNAFVIGHPGTGKSALVYELARRMTAGDPALPAALRECDIFELSPAFLRAGASLVGQYEERIKSLLDVLGHNPRIILFVDEVHSLFQSGVHVRGPFNDANESLKGALGRGEITCIGCTTLNEYRHFIEPDQALVRRFSVIRIDPPSPEATVRILEARLPRIRKFYASLSIPSEILGRAVALTEEHLPARAQPDKAIQLLDEACACCTTADPPLAEVTEEALLAVLEDLVGHGLLRRGRITEDEVYASLREKILGQDSVLRAVSRAFVAGLGGWRRRGGPRGVYLFAGPTGVGKTETAVLLARILGGGRDSLLRVDCNTLQGSRLDSGPIINRLLGVPPGYVGYARGQGGLLSRIRDLQESVVLFDEMEKAAAGLGQLLLQVFDDGRVEDVDGNLLDFRRSYIVMTTNLGCEYDRRSLGFATGDRAPPAVPRVDEEALRRELMATGLGPEFLGRIEHVFLFAGLEGDVVKQILARQLRDLRDLAEGQGLSLAWSSALVDHLVSQWQPRFGARHLGAVLRNRVTEQLGVAEAHGLLSGVRRIRLDVMTGSVGDGELGLIGIVACERSGDELIIRLQ